MIQKLLTVGIFGGAVLFGAACSAGLGEVADNDPDVRTNIIVLVADDMGYGDVGSYGHPSIRTPNLDGLAANGQRWTDFYANAAVCSPSRGALMTGRLPIRTGLYGIQLPVMFPNERAGIPVEETTLPEALQNLGYDTAMLGKWHLGDSPEALPTRHGFDEWFGVPYSNDMDWAVGMNIEQLLTVMLKGDKERLEATMAERYKLYLDPKDEYWNGPLIKSRQVGKGFSDEIVEQPLNQRLLTKRYTEQAVSYIESHASHPEKPFFLYLAYSMPHVPLFSSEEFVDHSRAGRYGDVIEEIDWSVGQIRLALEKQGLADNTLVVFTSDNGPWLAMDAHSGSSGPLKLGKGTTFEGGMRVPGIFWWPGTIAPSIVSEIGSIMDIYATAIDIAGGQLLPDTEYDSVNLSPVLRDSDTSPREFLPFYRKGELYAFREGEYKIHFVTEGAYGMPPVRTEHEIPQLFHLGQDPGERFNLAAQQPEKLKELVQAAEAHRSSVTRASAIFDARLKLETMSQLEAVVTP